MCLHWRKKELKGSLNKTKKGKSFILQNWFFTMLLPILFSLTEIWNDFNLILKIFVIMTIYSWVKNHMGNSAVGTIVFAAVTFFVVFDMWKLFGSIYLMWMLLMFGISQIIIDFFFVTPHGQKQELESPVGGGSDVLKRRQDLGHMQHAFAQKFMKR